MSECCMEKGGKVFYVSFGSLSLEGVVSWNSRTRATCLGSWRTALIAYCEACLPNGRICTIWLHRMWMVARVPKVTTVAEQMVVVLELQNTRQTLRKEVSVPWTRARCGSGLCSLVLIDRVDQSKG